MVPEKFQIVLVLNEYGDFLSDMACGLAGSLGIGASANLAFDPAAVVRVALFDAAHGTAPDIAGKNLANPTAIFLALSLLLYQLGEIAIGQAVKNATLDLLRQGVRTRDLGGQESTDSFTEAVAAEVARRLAAPDIGSSRAQRTVAKVKHDASQRKAVHGRAHVADRRGRGRAGGCSRMFGSSGCAPDHDGCPGASTWGLLFLCCGRRASRLGSSGCSWADSRPVSSSVLGLVRGHRRSGDRIQNNLVSLGVGVCTDQAECDWPASFDS